MSEACESRVARCHSEGDASRRTKYYERIGESRSSSSEHLLSLLAQLSSMSWEEDYDSEGDDMELDAPYLNASVFDTPPSTRSLSPVQQATSHGPNRFYRSKSLRSALRTPSDTQNPSTPKKMVRFADALGLDLEQIQKLEHDCLSRRYSPPSLNLDSKSRATRYLITGFNLACGRNTDRILDKQQVALESCSVSHLTITGVVKVSNIAYQKYVSVKYTVDNWTTESQVSASYIPGSSDGFVDKFVFSLVVDSSIEERRECEFVVEYCVAGQIYFDNNNGCNYRVRVCVL